MPLQKERISPKKEKSNWTREEDALLKRIMIEESKEYKWAKIAKKFNEKMGCVQRKEWRKGKQVRERWVQHLDPELCRKDLTEEEKYLIIGIVEKIGVHFVEIAEALYKKCGNKHSDNKIKNWWNSQNGKVYQSNNRNLKKKRMLKDEEIPVVLGEKNVESSIGQNKRCRLENEGDIGVAVIAIAQDERVESREYVEENKNGLTWVFYTPEEEVMSLDKWIETIEGCRQSRYGEFNKLLEIGSDVDDEG